MCCRILLYGIKAPPGGARTPPLARGRNAAVRPEPRHCARPCGPCSVAARSHHSVTLPAYPPPPADQIANDSRCHPEDAPGISATTRVRMAKCHARGRPVRHRQHDHYSRYSPREQIH